MATREQVRQAMANMTHRSLEGRTGFTFTAEVVTVYKDTRTCDVLSLGGTGMPETLFEGVRLIPDAGDGLLYVPAVGSTVLASAPANVTPCVVMWSELDEIVLTGSNSTLTLKDGLAQFNDGSHGGVPIASKILDNVNELKSYIKTVLEPGIVTAFNAVGVGPAANGPAGAASITANVVPKQITVVGVENDKVKH